MLRAITAVASAVALQVAALGAPLVHAHLDDRHEGHHGAARVHAHLGGHGIEHHVSPQDGPAMEPGADPEQVSSLPLFVATHVEAPASPALLRTRYALPALLESVMRRPPAVVRSHGPPAASQSNPRAPPVLSVLI